MTLNCNHIFIVTGRPIAFCTDVLWGRPVSVSSHSVIFIYESWSFLGTIAFLCWCAVKQSINQFLSYQFRPIKLLEIKCIQNYLMHSIQVVLEMEILLTQNIESYNVVKAKMSRRRPEPPRPVPSTLQGQGHHFFLSSKILKAFARGLYITAAITLPYPIFPYPSLLN